MSNAFIEGFRQATGREPTQADYARMQQRRDQKFKAQYPDEPSTAEKIAEYAAPVAGAALTAYMPTLFGTGAAAGGTAAAAGGTAAAAGGTAAAAGGAGAGAAGATTAGLGAGATTTGLGAGLATAGPVAAAIAAMYLSYQQYKAAEGKSAGDVIDDWSNPMNWVGGVGGILGSRDFFGTKKTQDQMIRDKLIRDRAQKMGIMDDNYMYNGVDLGKDGGFRFEDGRQIFDVAAANEDGTVTFSEEQAKAAGQLNPLGYLISGGDDKFGGQVTGMYVNALQEGGEDGITDAEIRQLYDRTGLGQAELFEGINDLYQQQRISEEEARAAQNSLNTIYGQEYISPESEQERAELINRYRETFYG